MEFVFLHVNPLRMVIISHASVAMGSLNVQTNDCLKWTALREDWFGMMRSNAASGSLQPARHHLLTLKEAPTTRKIRTRMLPVYPHVLECQMVITRAVVLVPAL